MRAKANRSSPNHRGSRGRERERESERASDTETDGDKGEVKIPGQLKDFVFKTWCWQGSFLQSSSNVPDNCSSLASFSMPGFCGQSLGSVCHDDSK